MILSREQLNFISFSGYESTFCRIYEVQRISKTLSGITASQFAESCASPVADISPACPINVSETDQYLRNPRPGLGTEFFNGSLPYRRTLNDLIANTFCDSFLEFCDQHFVAKPVCTDTVCCKYCAFQKGLRMTKSSKTCCSEKLS